MKKIILITQLVLSTTVLFPDEILPNKIDFIGNIGLNLSINEAASFVTFDTSLMIIKGILYCVRAHFGQETRLSFSNNSSGSMASIFSDPPPKNKFSEITLMIGYPLYFDASALLVNLGPSYIDMSLYESSQESPYYIEEKIHDLGIHGRVDWIVFSQSGLAGSAGINLTYVPNHPFIVGINGSVSISSIRLKGYEFKWNKP